MWAGLEGFGDEMGKVINIIIMCYVNIVSMRAVNHIYLISKKSILTLN